MRYLLILISVLFVVFIAFQFLYPSYLSKQIDKANYCSLDSDCQTIQEVAICPISCQVIVNKKETQRINQLVEYYKQWTITERFSVCQCITDKKNIQCLSNKCEKVIGNYENTPK